MNMKKLIVLGLAVLLVLSLAACGTKDNDKMGDMGSKDSAMTGEPKSAEEALSCTRNCKSRRTRSCQRTPHSGIRSSWRPTRAWP